FGWNAVCADAGKIDDCAAATLLHQRYCLLRDKKCCACIDIHRPVPALDALFHHGSVVTRCRVVHQDVQAIKRLLCFLKEPFEIGLLTHVGANEGSGSAQGANLVSGLFGRRPIAEEVDGNVCPFACKAQSNGLADPSAAASNEGDLTSETLFGHALGS